MFEEKVGKKGVSPVVATVIIISIVLVLAVIIFIWAMSFFGERCFKFGVLCQDSCDDVNLQASYSSATKDITIKNLGNVAVSSVIVKYGDGKNLDTSDEIDVGLSQGKSAIVHFTDGSPQVIIPVLEGANDDGDVVTYSCTKKEFDVL